MELVEFTGDVEVIQKLGTFPNAEDGLTAEDLKKKFDEAPTAIKKYLNETLVPEVNRIGKNAGKPISVTITTVDGALTADKSYAELYAAHVAGQTVHCKLPDGSVLALATADENDLLFQGENGRDYQQIIIGADGTITYKSGKYALLGELVTDATIGVYPSGDGYESTDTLEDLQESAKAGRTIVCNLEVGDGELLRLPMTKREDDAFHFSAVFEGKEYMVTINADGVTVEISDCGGGNSGGNANYADVSNIKTVLGNIMTIIKAQTDSEGGVERPQGYNMDVSSLVVQNDALIAALGGSGGGDTPDEPDTEKTLTGITATYNGGSVTAGTAVTALTSIVVTAHYSDGTSEVVTGYTLSGAIAEGDNTITVSYGGKTTTITVAGVSNGGSDAVNLYSGELLKTNNINDVVQNGNVISYTVGANGGTATFTIEGLEANKDYTIFVDTDRAETSSGKYCDCYITTEEHAVYTGRIAELHPANYGGKDYATFTANGNTLYLWFCEMGVSVTGLTPTYTVHIYEGTLTEKP